MMIYRVQDEKGRGPFQPGMTEKWADADRVYHLPFYAESPEVLVEIRNTKGGHLGCGCVSGEQLKTWFSAREFQRLKDMGFMAVRMNVNRIIHKNDKECVFFRKRALNKKVHMIELYSSAK